MRIRITIGADVPRFGARNFRPHFFQRPAPRGWFGCTHQSTALGVAPGLFNLGGGEPGSRFQTLGTLMAVGLMMLPAVSARLWHDALPAQPINASVQAALANAGGLLLSYYWDTPSGPTIIGCVGLLYFASLLIAPGGWLPRLRATQHRVA
jgi:ABC 3 transport family